MFTIEEKILIKMTILEKINIFKQSPNLWKNDQKNYQNILKKLKEIEVNESALRLQKL